MRSHSDSIWVAKFSPCGRYLATGGKDAVLKIWEVSLLNVEQRNVDKPNETYKLFNEKPLREYMEHESDIIDIEWSMEK